LHGCILSFIISDWNLPDGTGIEFLKHIRKMPKFKNIPFVMCTTLSEIGNILDAINNGANEFITKTWSVDELKECLITLIGFNLTQKLRSNACPSKSAKCRRVSASLLCRYTISTVQCGTKYTVLRM
jgi:CheY-like chemotaxis protein